MNMESKNFLNNNPKAGQEKTEREKMIEMGIITPENSKELQKKEEEINVEEIIKEPEKFQKEFQKENEIDVDKIIEEPKKEELSLSKEETLTLYRLLRGKGESAEEVPADFKLPSEIEKNAADFFKTRSRYVEEWDKHQRTLKTLEKSKSKKGDIEYIDAKRYLENVN